MGQHQKRCLGDELGQLFHEYKRCTDCSLHTNRKVPVYGKGSISADVVFIVDKLSEESIRASDPLVGARHTLLETVVKSMGKSITDMWITPTVLCPAKDAKDPKISELKACRERLSRELHLVQPSAIVALGTLAIKSLIPKDPPTITHNAGRVVEAFIQGDLTEYPVPVVLTYSPSFLLRNPDNSPGGLWNKFFNHVSKAFEIAESEKLIKMGKKPNFRRTDNV